MPIAARGISVTDKVGNVLALVGGNGIQRTFTFPEG